MKSRLLLARSAAGKEGAADRAAAMSVLERRLPPRRTAANCGCWRRARSSIWKISQKRASFLALADEGKEDAEEMRSGGSIVGLSRQGLGDGGPRIQRGA